MLGPRAAPSPVGVGAPPETVGVGGDDGPDAQPSSGNRQATTAELVTNR
jgi:hypothetical protein